MKTLSDAKRAQVIACICKGNSVRSTVRITGVAKNTVAKLLVELGNVCIEYQDRVFRNLKCKRVQCDEIWSFVYAKQKNVPNEMSGKFGVGDVWTWVAIDADTKLIPSFMMGNRDGRTAKIFIEDLASRLASRVQLTTDGLKAYLNAVEDASGSGIDYAMLNKIYAASQEETRYSPAECIRCETKRTQGNPDPIHILTSYSERQNLSARMMIRRFTRLTNAFSKKAENHLAAVSVYFMYYNFARIHATLRVTPAMEAGISNHIWEISEILGLLPEPKASARGPYKKRNSD
ncbi:MAG TPA: DDE-type integrase/transposase/recombinase [Terriglobia bacterium]|nr:DDE-type integrase/transposase/recombinase [Terriglobia bacterium]